MPIFTHILNATGKLDAVVPYIEPSTTDLATRINQLLQIPRLDICISPLMDDRKPECGIAGYSFNPARLELVIDSVRDDIKRVLQQELAPVLAHEMHHCARAAYCKDVTLADHMITEGLACHFEKHFNGGKVPGIFNNLAPHGWRDLFHMAEPVLQKSEFSFEKWFLGSDPANIPKYAGYWIGYNLVADYLVNRNIAESSLLQIQGSSILRSFTRA